MGLMAAIAMSACISELLMLAAQAVSQAANDWEQVGADARCWAEGAKS